VSRWARRWGARLIVALGSLAGCASNGASADSGTPAAGDATAACSTVTTQAACEARIGCHVVLEQSKCPGSGVPCPYVFMACAEGPSGTMMCNDLPQTAPRVSIRVVAAPRPTPLGGTPVSGTYFLTSATLYNGPDGGAGPNGDSRNERADITVTNGTTMGWQIVQTGTGGAIVHQTFTLVLDGSTLARSSNSCPFTGTGAVQYTATKTEVRLYLVNSPEEEDVYTRQP
jgi:hypothetical protein